MLKEIFLVMFTTNNSGMFCTSSIILTVIISWITCNDAYLQDINTLVIYQLYSFITFSTKVSYNNFDNNDSNTLLYITVYLYNIILLYMYICYCKLYKYY